jgi:hypothetical protein
LVYRCHYSTDYEGQFITVSVPFSWVRQRYPAVASKILGDAAAAAIPLGIGGSLPPEVTSTLAALRTAFGQLLSKNGSINFFVGPTQPHSFGISIGIGGGASFNGSSSKPSLGWSYYYQDLPRFDYPYNFREQ